LEPVEHVVGRVMDEERADPAGLLRHDVNGSAVHRGGEPFLILSLVDRRIGGGVYDDVGLETVNELRQPLRPRQVALPAVKRDYVPERREAAAKFPPDLSVGPRNQQPHGNSSASRSDTLALSLAESVGSTSVGQSMPIAGSFQATLRACSGV